MGKTNKDIINWHRFHGKEKEIPTELRDKYVAMDSNGGGARHGNKRKFEAALKMKRRRAEKRSTKRIRDEE